MKTVLRIVGVIVVCLVVVLVVLSITGYGPHDRTPGLWLKGKVVASPVTDWSFADNYPTVQLQTRSWYLLPHSVNIGCEVFNGQLYVSTVDRAGTPAYVWNENAMRNRHIRIKIGDQVYDGTASLVTDAAEQHAVLEARTKKYHGLSIPPGSVYWIFRIAS